MSNQKALDAIAKINEKFPKYGNSIKIRTEGQSILPTDPTYDFMNPANNKGTPTLSDNYLCFRK